MLDFKSHRFLGLTIVMHCIVEKWNEITRWYDARMMKAEREGKEPPRGFSLINQKTELIHILSLLLLITVLNTKINSKIQTRWSHCCCFID
uniref:Uncharacterized protein n=1 Tax=Globisporangium ultimum (strain ATCC 200006 / CBS 805.95 / DAOM BR144) TaxID=431595 RepID=K3WBD2_GLOUD